jgi:hypothetical protein
MNDRVTLLLARELDGSLSDLERAELERKILLCPDARRDRAGWKKVIGALKQDGPTRKLPLARMAAEIAKQAHERAPILPFEKVRRVVLATAVLAAGLALFSIRPPRERAVEPAPKPAVAASDPAPVELSIDPEVREEEVAVVTIRF